jgi:hypothetical protein
MKAIVDVEDFEKLNQYDWHGLVTKRNVYAYRAVSNRSYIIRMHREIMLGTNSKSENRKTKLNWGPRNNTLVVDHINNNSLDNRKANLRIATRWQNRYNSRPWAGNVTSKYKGVCWEKETKKWRSLLTHNGKRESLGRFENEIDAAKAYDEAAKKYHGKYAWLNFPDTG